MKLNASWHPTETPNSLRVLRSLFSVTLWLQLFLGA